VRRLVLAAALPLAACLFDARDGATPPIVPLALDNAWTYAESTFQDGVLTETWSSETSITAKRALEGGPTVFVQNTRNRFTLAPGPYSVYVNNVGASHYTYGAEEHGVSVRHETLHLKWPAKRGERYLTQFVGVDTLSAEPVLDTLEIEVVNPDTACATLAGTFACVHYRGYRLDGSVYADTWYAPGVGYLGSEVRRFVQRDGGLRESRHVKKLTSYTLH
jgi:hypothetical protein